MKLNVWKQKQNPVRPKHVDDKVNNQHLKQIKLEIADSGDGVAGASTL